MDTMTEALRPANNSIEGEEYFEGLEEEIGEVIRIQRSYRKSRKTYLFTFGRVLPKAQSDKNLAGNFQTNP